MQQRVRCLIAATAVVASATSLAGCSAGSSNGGKELHILVGTNAQYPAQYRAWLDKLKQRFKAKTGANITFETFASATDEQTKIQTSVISGDGPDVYQTGTTFTPVAYATKAFHVLSDADWNKIGGRQRFIPQSLGISGPNAQHQIGVPMSVRPYGMVYNTELFKAAGIPGPPKTWDELVADGQKLTHPGQGVYGAAVAYADSYDPWKYIWANTLQSGGRLLSDDLKRAELNSPQTTAATNHYFDLLTKDHIVDPKAVSWKQPEALGAFGAGKAAMQPMIAPSTRPSLDGSSVKGKYAYAPMPLVPPGATSRPPNALAAGSIVSGDNLAVASYSKHTDLALAYINMVTSPDLQKEYSQTFGDLPSNASVAQQLANGDSQDKAFLEAEKTSVPTSFTGAWSEVQLGLSNVVKQSLPALSKGGYDPAAVTKLLTDANQKAQASLDRHKN
ncbi:MAG: ABC transporter substrate-binding protein [Actinoallomurus sp.]